LRAIDNQKGERWAVTVQKWIVAIELCCEVEDDGGDGVEHIGAELAVIERQV
jgi:hypothetical protein